MKHKQTPNLPENIIKALNLGKKERFDLIKLPPKDAPDNHRWVATDHTRLAAGRTPRKALEALWMMRKGLI